MKLVSQAGLKNLHIRKYISALPPYWRVRFVPVNLQYTYRSFYHSSSASQFFSLKRKLKFFFPKNPPQAKYTQNNFMTINMLVLIMILR